MPNPCKVRTLSGWCEHYSNTVGIPTGLLDGRITVTSPAIDVLRVPKDLGELIFEEAPDLYWLQCRNDRQIAYFLMRRSAAKRIPWLKKAGVMIFQDLRMELPPGNEALVERPQCCCRWFPFVPQIPIMLPTTAELVDIANAVVAQYLDNAGELAWQR